MSENVDTDIADAFRRAGDKMIEARQDGWTRSPLTRNVVERLRRNGFRIIDVAVACGVDYPEARRAVRQVEGPRRGGR